MSDHGTGINTDEKWQAIMQASTQLLEAAEQERWLELPTQARLRDRLIREYFTRPITVESALRIQDQVEEILAIDQQVLGLARREREQTRSVLQNLRSGAAAVKAYQG